MTVLVRTADLAPTDREEAWRHTVEKSFVSCDFDFPDRADIQGEIHGTTLGQITVTSVTAGAHRALRTERHISRANDAGFYKLSLPLRGYVLISQDGREAPLIPGDLAIYDTSRPYQVTFDDRCRMLVLMFPHRDLRLPQQSMREVTACRVSGRHGIGGLVAPLLINLASRLDELDGTQSARLADNVVDLVTTLYAEQLPGPTVRGTDSMLTLLVRIKAHIQQHLDHPDLGPESISTACHVSIGYLHKLFRAEGMSVSRYIRELRLEQCRRDLSNPGRRSTTVSAIGAHWGFFDAAHFSRVFKAAYGASPREYRVSRDILGNVGMAATTED